MSLNDYKLGLKNKKEVKNAKRAKRREKTRSVHSKCSKQTVPSWVQTNCLNLAQTQVQAPVVKVEILLGQAGQTKMVSFSKFPNSI